MTRVVSGIIDERQCMYCKAMQGMREEDLTDLPPFSKCTCNEDDEEMHCRCYMTLERRGA